MKKIPLLLMCLACIAAQASDHGSDHESLSDGGDQGVQTLEGSPHGSRSASRNSVADGQAGVADQLLEAMGDQEQKSSLPIKKRVRSKSCGDLDELQKDLSGKRLVFHEATLARAKKEGFQDLAQGSSGSSSDDDQGDGDDFTDLTTAMSGAPSVTQSRIFAGQVSLREFATAAKTVAGVALDKTYQITGQIHEVWTGSRNRLPVSLSEEDVVSPLASQIAQLLLKHDQEAVLNLLKKNPVGMAKALTRVNDNGFAPFHLALQLPPEKRTEIVKAMWLCNKKVLNTQDRNGCLVLNDAVKDKKAEEIEFLVTHGANPEQADQNGEKAYGLLVKIFSEKKEQDSSADINKDPLMQAVHKGREKNLELTFDRKIARQLEKSKGKK